MRTGSHKYAALVSLLLAFACSGCGLVGRPINAWVSGEMVQLTDRTEPQGGVIYSPTDHVISLPAGANEVVSFQIAVDAEERALSNLRLAFSNLTGPNGRRIASGSFQAYRMWPIRIETFPAWYVRLTDAPAQPAGFYDPLTPIDHHVVGQPFSVPAGERMAFWVDIVVPRDAGPGLYEGETKISADGHARWVGRIKLQIHEYALPDANPVAAVGGFDYRDVFRTLVRVDGKPYVPRHLARRYEPVREGLSFIRQMMRLAHSHRLDLFDRSLHPTIGRNPDGSVHLNWADYDAIVLPYLTGSAFDDKIGCSAWPMPLRQDWPEPADYGGLDSKAYRRAVLAIAQSCKEHFDGLGEFGRQMFHWPCREEVSQHAYDLHAYISRMVRTTDASTPILTELPACPPTRQMLAVPSDFRQLADAYVPPGQWLDPRQAPPDSVDRHKLAGLWLAPGMPPFVPPVGVLASPGDTRAMCWLVAKYSCRGLFFPDVLNWASTGHKPFGEGQLRFFYPGSTVGVDGVVVSASLKRHRRGMQDIAALWILQQRQRPGIAAALVNAMARYAGAEAAGDNYQDARLYGWVSRPEIWDQASTLLAKEVQSAVHPETYTGQGQIAEQLAWQKFDQQASRIRIDRVRTRLTPIQSPGAAYSAETGEAIRAELSVELMNEHDRGMAVSAEIGKLPTGWQPVKASECIPLLPAKTLAEIELVARGAAFPSSGQGKVPLELIVKSEQDTPTKMLVEMPMILCQRYSGNVTIDGSLDDWPLRAGNCAGAFKLLGRRGMRNADPASASRQTAAFVLRNADELLIAVRCEELDPTSLFARSDNMVRYSQLMAVGEDLVEIILDPGRIARDPSGLYHIAVKANGVVITERGIGCHPPLGEAIPWPAQVTVSVGRGSDHWAVEMAVPLASFGAKARSAVWGIDFTRCTPKGNEASSWSGAPRYFYDARQLGTMLMRTE